VWFQCQVVPTHRRSIWITARSVARHEVEAHWSQHGWYYSGYRLLLTGSVGSCMHVLIGTWCTINVTSASCLNSKLAIFSFLSSKKFAKQFKFRPFFTYKYPQGLSSFHINFNSTTSFQLIRSFSRLSLYHYIVLIYCFTGSCFVDTFREFYWRQRQV
jgi:hypothetical protein